MSGEKVRDKLEKVLEKVKPASQKQNLEKLEEEMVEILKKEGVLPKKEGK